MAQSLFPHQKLHGLNGGKLQEMIFAETGQNWNNLPTEQKRGRVVRHNETGGWFVDRDPPTFTQDRKYLRWQIPQYEV